MEACVACVPGFERGWLADFDCDQQLERSTPQLRAGAVPRQGDGGCLGQRFGTASSGQAERWQKQRRAKWRGFAALVCGRALKLQPRTGEGLLCFLKPGRTEGAAPLAAAVPNRGSRASELSGRGAPPAARAAIPNRGPGPAAAHRDGARSHQDREGAPRM